MNKVRVKKALCTICIVSILWTSSIYSTHAAPQPPEYSNYDFDNQALRVEPDGEGSIFDVSFFLNSGPIYESFAALEGQGIGKEQWPPDPSREGYSFVGWYDNVEGDRSPYSMDTPIYEDTILYVKWKYSGSGGCWPRPHRGILHGIEEGSSFDINQSISITAEGYNMHLVTPNDQRFRWIPVSWNLSDLMNGNYLGEAPYFATFSIDMQGEYKFYITYKEEIFDGVNWQETGQIHEVEELTFQVLIKTVF